MNHWQFLVAFFTDHPQLQYWHNWQQLRADAIQAFPHLHWLRHWPYWQQLLAFLRTVGGRGV